MFSNVSQQKLQINSETSLILSMALIFIKIIIHKTIRVDSISHLVLVLQTMKALHIFLNHLANELRRYIPDTIKDDCLC